MLTDRSCGVIPVFMKDGQRQYLLVRHGQGHWGFPKGHVENDETPQQTARRELAEETGIQNLKLLDEPALHEHYYLSNKDGRRVRKDVTYFIGLVEDPAVRPCPGEISACQWGTVQDTRERLAFAKTRQLLELADAHLDSAEP